MISLFRECRLLLPFEDYQELNLENIKEACERFYNAPAGSCDILASDRGSSCSKLEEIKGCKAHLLDHRHFHVLDVAVVGQIKVHGHRKTSSMIAGIMIVSLHRPKVLTKTVQKFTLIFVRTTVTKQKYRILSL